MRLIGGTREQSSTVHWIEDSLNLTLIKLWIISFVSLKGTEVKSIFKVNDRNFGCGLKLTGGGG